MQQVLAAAVVASQLSPAQKHTAIVTASQKTIFQLCLNQLVVLVKSSRNL